MANQLYDRLPDESSKAFEAFSHYKNLGIERTIELAWKRYSKSDRTVPGYFKQWSSDYNWVERSRAYDEFVDAQARKKLESDAIKQRAEMLKRHALTGKVLQQKGVQYLEKSGIDKSSDAVNAIKTGITIERQSSGLPEYLMEVVNVDDAELTRKYAALLAEIGGVASGDDEAGDTDPGTATPETPTE